MNVRRLYAPVVLGTLAAGGLAFFTASRTWAHARIAAEGLPPDTVKVSGSDAQPIVTALALVAVTAALAVLASSPRLRRGVGVFTVIVALAGIVVVLTGGSSVDDAVAKAVKASPAFTGSNTPTTHHTIWLALTVVAFLLVAGLGAVTARFGPLWPTMSSRYDAPRVRAAKVAPQTDADMWKALDEGHDPTQ
ncbi:MAG: family rane protein [Aeromicrobium sp.]|nr:family rane protein [Aeromicrobium sp.]